jgi:hypothetical protein
MVLNRDWKEFIESFNANGVEYLIVGAIALAYHGHPRTTGDIDFFIRDSADNVQRILKALHDFGFDSLGLKESDFIGPDKVIQLGIAPCRIDILTSIEGVAFDHAWEDREAATLDGIPVSYLSRADFLANKRAVGRPKDLADIDLLGE